MMAENLFATVQNGPHHLFWNPLPAASSKPSYKAPPKNKRWRQIERKRRGEDENWAGCSIWTAPRPPNTTSLLLIRHAPRARARVWCHMSDFSTYDDLREGVVDRQLGRRRRNSLRLPSHTRTHTYTQTRVHTGLSPSPKLYFMYLHHRRSKGTAHCAPSLRWTWQASRVGVIDDHRTDGGLIMPAGTISKQKHRLCFFRLPWCILPVIPHPVRGPCTSAQMSFFFFFLFIGRAHSHIL